MAPTQEQESACGDYVNPPEESVFPERIVDILAAFTARHRLVEEAEIQEELIPINPYEDGPIPHLPNLHEILRDAAGGDELETVSEVKLKVIAHDVGLQHLSAHMPVLRELILDGSVVDSLRDLGSGLKMLKVLKVNRCGLTSLDGVYGMKNISELYAAHNFITDLTPCTTLDTIRLINVRKNKLRNINSLGFLSVSESLRHIVLENNSNLTDLPDYRAKVKRLLPKLKSLDGVEFPEEDGDCNASASCSTVQTSIRREENRMISRNVSLPPIQIPKTSRINKSESISSSGIRVSSNVRNEIAPTSSSTKSNPDGYRRLPSASSSGSSSSRNSSVREANTSSSSGNCSYSVSFSPRVLSPRADGGNEDGVGNSSDIKVHKVELPKI